MAARDKKSKKPSATSLKPREEIVFFVDASLGSKVVPQALRNAGAKVEIHDDHFAQGTPDETWLRSVGERGWVVLTKEDRIRFHDLEKKALLAAGTRAFVLTAKGLRGAENGAILAAALKSVYHFLENHPAPFIAKISRSGTVALIPLDSR